MTGRPPPLDDLRSTLGEYARIVQRRWRPGLLGLALVASAAFWYSQYLPRQYRASTIFERRDDVVLRNLVHGNSPYSFDQLKSTLAMDMTGSRAMAETAAALGLLAPELVPPQGALPESALRALDATLRGQGLEVSVTLLHTSPSLDTIRLECQAGQAPLARAFLVALRDRYIAQAQARLAAVLADSKRFFETEVERLTREMAVTERSLRAAFDDFPGLDPTDLAGTGTRLESIRLERDRALERTSELEAQIAAREDFLAGTLATLSDEQAEWTAGSTAAPEPAPGLAKALAELQQQMFDAITLRRMTPDHPTVVGLQRKLDALYLAQQELAAQPAAAPAEAQRRAAVRRSAERVRIELELDALRRQWTVVQAVFAQADERATRLGTLYDRLVQHGEELRAVRDQLEQDAATVALWRQNLGQLNRILAAAGEARGTQFTLLEEPQDPERPVAPMATGVFAVCGGAGLAVAALLVVLAELLDRSFRSAGQITHVLGVPVMTGVGVIPTPRVRRRRLAGRLFWFPVIGLLLSILAATAALAYTSLARPALHRQVVSQMDAALSRLSVAVPWSAPRQG